MKLKIFNKQLFIALFCGIITTGNATKYVTVYGNGTQSGNSWANAAPASSLQNMINAAQINAEEVWVAAGTYYLTNAINMQSSVKIYGGFPAGGGSWAQRNWQLYQTILNGQNITNIISNTNIGTPTNLAIIDGFYLKSGSATNGGGIFNYNSSARFTNISIDYCNADKNGGGMYDTLSNIQCTQISITYCSAVNGAGIYNTGTDFFLADGVIAYNTYKGFGGGFYQEENDFSISSADIYENHPAPFFHGTGGGISITNVNEGIIKYYNKIHHNTARIGGGIYAEQSNLWLFDFGKISYNVATASGGGIANNHSRIRISLFAITWNTAYQGGGMYNKYYTGDDAYLNTVLIANNDAVEGSGILNVGYNIGIEFATITQNSAKGIENWYGELNIGSSIIWDNGNGSFLENLENHPPTPATQTVECSNIQNSAGVNWNNYGFTASQVIDYDPVFTDASQQDYHLVCGSPCIDKACGTRIDNGVDLDGVPMQGSRYDMGCYEALCPSSSNANPLQLNIYPNPALAETYSTLTIEPEFSQNQKVRIEVLNFYGMKINEYQTAENSCAITVPNQQGQYIIRATNYTGESISTILIVQ
jgi:hypothetical protein